MQKHIDIIFKNIDYKVKDRNTGKWLHILKGVSGQVKSGECLALMGASGAGKSSLLNILSGRIKPGKNIKLEGEILYNGQQYDLNKINAFSGFVMQSDILLEFLTVQETLEFGANLKIKGTQEQKLKRAKELISEFKLEGTEETYVGGETLKGLSGGQRKRVNIALELINDPPVLFLDEPTSGLDSYTSEVVIKKLDELAKKLGKTIIYVIHQPSSDIFRKMDKLMLLYRGKTIYFGKAGAPAVKYFDQLGFKCDKNTNPSDFFMYIMQSKQEGLESYLTESFSRNVSQDLDIKRDGKIKINVDDFPGMATQMSQLFKRSLKLLVRNPSMTTLRFVQVIGMAFFFCSVYFQIEDDENDPAAAFNRNGALFFACFVNLIPPMMAQLITFPVERKVFLKEHKSRFYKVLPYYVARNLIEIPFSLLFPVMFCLMTYWIVGFNTSSFDLVMKQALTYVNLTFCSTGFGVFLGCVFNDVEVALNITPLLFYPMLLFSGFYVNSNSIQDWLKWAEAASPMRYTLEALVYTEYEGTGYNPNPIQSFGYDRGYWDSNIILMFYGVGMRILGFLALWINAKF